MFHEQWRKSHILRLAFCGVVWPEAWPYEKQLPMSQAKCTIRLNI